MHGDLRAAFATGALDLAFRRLLKGSNYAYKNKFRDAYDSFALCLPQGMSTIRQQLDQGIYKPTHATKIFLPKKGGVQRLYSLLCVEDQVIYQALAGRIADRVYPQVKSRYLNSVFGNLYQGPQSDYFYIHYNKAHERFRKAKKVAYGEGFVYAATFDLTAFFDSIDHKVLSTKLQAFGLDKEFCEFLTKCLEKWTACVVDPPIYQGQGIPQGPLSSGILAECVLSYFDEKCPVNGSQVRYFRYVDDIEIFARSERSLRHELVELDYRSKEIGLFPQTSKINIRRVRDIDKELRTVTSEDLNQKSKPSPDQGRVRARLKALTRGLRVTEQDRTAFAFVLSGSAYETSTAKRLLSVLERQPELFQPISQYFAAATHLTPAVCRELLRISYDYSLYPAIPSEFLRILADSAPRDLLPTLAATAVVMLRDPRTQNSHDLHEGVWRLRMLDPSTQWGQKRTALLSEKNWWVQASMTSQLSPAMAPSPDSYRKLVNRLLRESTPTALAASRLAGEAHVSVDRPRAGIPTVAQMSLRRQGLIGRVSPTDSPIEDAMQLVIGTYIRAIDWRKVLASDYSMMIPAVVDWAGCYATNPTEWVMIGNTINDVILDHLFASDGTIGCYQRGNIGGALPSGARFASQYPDMHSAAIHINDLRSVARPSHAVSRRTNAVTRRIRHEELGSARLALARGYREIWDRHFSSK